ncbi:hypothetical protein [Haladaptatus sp. NG-WS-4]
MSPTAGWPTPVIALVLFPFVALVAVVTFRRMQEDFFHPLALVGGIVTYYILTPGLYLLATGNFRLEHPSGAYATLLAAVCVLAATYVAIVAGYRLSDSKSNALITRLINHRPIRSDGGRFISINAKKGTEIDVCRGLVWVGSLAIVVGVISYLYYVFVNGGFIRLLTVRPRTAFQNVPNTGRYKLFATAGIYAGTIVALVGMRPKIERRTLSKFERVAITVLIPFVLMVAISFRSRMNIAIIGGFLILYFYSAKRIPERIIVGATAALVVFGLSFSFVERVITSGEISLALLIEPFVSNIRLEIIMEVIREVPRAHPYQFGSTLWWIIPSGVPWAPPRMGNQIESIIFGTSRDTYTAPALFVAEMWLNFGLVGTLLAGAIYGALLNVVHEAQKYLNSPLTRGIQPLVLLTVLSALPTSFEWSIRSMGFRLVFPTILAIATVYIVSRIVLPRLRPISP